VRKELDDVLGEARQVAEKRGAQGQENRPPLVLTSRYVELPDGRRIYYYEEHFLDFYAEQIGRSEEDAIVEVVALFNCTEGEPVDADFRLFANRVVFTRGTVLVTEDLDGRQPTGALFQKVLGTLERIRSLAREKGMRGGAENRYGEISYEELFTVLEQVRRLKTSVTLKVLAAEDTRAAGPLQVRLEIEKGPRAGGDS
jgi:hypothetical protein